MNIKSKEELYNEAYERVKEIVKSMNTLTEREFTEKYLFNPNFHRGMDVLVHLFVEVKFNK
jgi:hypothetical protein